MGDARIDVFELPEHAQTHLLRPQDHSRTASARAEEREPPPLRASGEAPARGRRAARSFSITPSCATARPSTSAAVAAGSAPAPSTSRPSKGEMKFTFKCASYHAVKCPASMRALIAPPLGEQKACVYLQHAEGWTQDHTGPNRAVTGLPPHIKTTIDVQRCGRRQRELLLKLAHPASDGVRNRLRHVVVIAVQPPREAKPEKVYKLMSRTRQACASQERWTEVRKCRMVQHRSATACIRRILRCRRGCRSIVAPRREPVWLDLVGIARVRVRVGVASPHCARRVHVSNDRPRAGRSRGGGACVAGCGGPHPTRGGVRAREARTHVAWHEMRGFAPAVLVRPVRL